MSAFLTAATHRAHVAWNPRSQRLAGAGRVRWVGPDSGFVLDSGCSGFLSLTSCVSPEKSLNLSESLRLPL